MTSPTARPSLWPSPISADLVVAGAARLSDVRAENGITWWSLSLPEEGGRLQIRRRERDGSVRDLLPAPFNARTRVHEYGGGAWWVDRGRVFFTDFADQRLYLLPDGSTTPVPISETPSLPSGLRYADGVLSPDGRIVVCVRERHLAGGEVINEIVALDAAPHGEDVAPATVLVSGHDFYASPRISPDGARLAWICWNHPDMPWDTTELWVADLADGVTGVSAARKAAGGPDESLMQPEWAPSGQLYVISDRDEWWNVYRVGEHDLQPVFPVAAEVGLPPWVFGRERYVLDGDGRVHLTYSGADGAHLVTVETDGTAQDSPVPGSAALVPLRLDHGDGRLLAIDSSPDRESSVIESTDGGRSFTALLPGAAHGLVAISRARRIDFPSAGGRTAHALYYAPEPAGQAPSQAGLPPLIVHVHGGPTSQAGAGFSLGNQYWTSRGFALVDVDYGGSTGYGRSYRSLLNGAWGVVDVEDAIAAATWLAEQGLADPARIAISGGSAGGFTVLMALATSGVFTAGANYFGVSDVAALARDTHKFESRYMDSLVGAWPEQAELYRQRSPLSHLDGFTAPLITFQGLEDRIVPPAQSEEIVKALAARGIPHTYLAYPGEQHGFRKAENIRRSLTAELSFYAQVFGLALSEDVEPVPIVGG